MTRPLLTAALVFFSLPAFAETYYLDKDAWTCEGYGAIAEVEQSAKQRSRDISLANSARCIFAGTTQGAPKDGLANSPTNIMYVVAPYAYVCQKITYCQPAPSMPVFYCTYALISDIRDSHGAAVSEQQLRKEAAGKTMADVKEFFPCMNTN
jgi:hypothetical protein